MNTNDNVLKELVDRYNDLTAKWLKGCDWLSDPNRTQEEWDRGFERLQLRLRQLAEVYNELVELGVYVEPEIFLDINTLVIRPPF